MAAAAAAAEARDRVLESRILRVREERRIRER